MTQESAKTPSPNRRRWWMTGAVITTVALGAGVIVFAVGALEVNRIDMTGLHRVSYDEALDAIDVRVGDFMLTLDSEAAGRALKELPWVLDARIQRRWPSGVEVNIVERSAAALALTSPGAWVLTDAEGRVLTHALTAPPKLPRLSGIAAAPKPGGFLSGDAEALLDVLDAASGQPGFSLVALWRDSRGDLRVRVQQLPGGPLLEVDLGDDSAVGAKTAAIAAVIADLEPSNSVLDVSVPHLPVLRPAN